MSYCRSNVRVSVMHLFQTKKMLGSITAVRNEGRVWRTAMLSLTDQIIDTVNQYACGLIGEAEATTKIQALKNLLIIKLALRKK